MGSSFKASATYLSSGRSLNIISLFIFLPKLKCYSIEVFYPPSVSWAGGTGWDHVHHPSQEHRCCLQNMFKNIKLWHKLQRLDQSSYLCHDSIVLVINKFPFGSLQIDKLAEAGRHNVEKCFWEIFKEVTSSHRQNQRLPWSLILVPWSRCPSWCSRRQEDSCRLHPALPDGWPLHLGTAAANACWASPSPWPCWSSRQSCRTNSCLTCFPHSRSISPLAACSLRSLCPLGQQVDAPLIDITYDFANKTPLIRI